MPKRSRLNNNLFFSNSIEELNIAKIAQRYDDKKLDVTCYSEILEERKGSVDSRREFFIRGIGLHLT